MATAYFLWGLKRSGNHLVADWLYANLGGRRRDPLDSGFGHLHEQLRDGFCDPTAGVAFFNNCGRRQSRSFGLGCLAAGDFDHALRRCGQGAIFGIEDCRLVPAAREAATAADTSHLLLLRDPLNNIASRLRGRRSRPDVFPTDAAYVDLYDSYSREYLDWTHHLPSKTVINFNRFVVDRGYRDAVARGLGIANKDAIDIVANYGGGSSFQQGPEPATAAALMTRYREEPIPAELLGLLAEKESIHELCGREFGYDLREVCRELEGRTR